MSFHQKIFSITTIFHFILLCVCSGQQPPKFSIAVERLFNKIESDIVTSASSFEEGNKAISMLTEKNAMDMFEFRGRKLPRLDLAFYGLTHANEHYGQMVVYLRMCGIIPPPTINEK